MLTDKLNDNEAVVCVVGLGYVGLPLAIEFSKDMQVIGYEIDEDKIKKLNNSESNQENKNLFITNDPTNIKNADFVIISVPTPVTRSQEPDLCYVKSASETISQNLKQDSVVILESTVYPGVTEEIEKPILEKSGLRCGKDFKVAYSPERINPGDDVHALQKITKIVSGMDEETTDIVSKLYARITTVYEAKDIRTAEAAKVTLEHPA